MFVIPSVFSGFILSYPTLDWINGLLFTPDMGIDIDPHPSGNAIF
jgi:hypothetical protein